MKNVIEYKGYFAELSLDIDDDIIVGRVINTADIISFHGDTIEEAKLAFHDVLDTYVESCEQEGIEPARPYSGKFNLRTTPELHKELSKQAKQKGMSLNEFVTSLLERTIHNHPKHA